MVFVFRTRVAAHTAPQWQEVCSRSAGMQSNWEACKATLSENELQISYDQARQESKLTTLQCRPSHYELDRQMHLQQDELNIGRWL